MTDKKEELTITVPLEQWRNINDRMTRAEFTLDILKHHCKIGRNINSKIKINRKEMSAGEYVVTEQWLRGVKNGR